MALVSEQVLRETEERLILLEQKAEMLEDQTTPVWPATLLALANLFMGASLILLILQSYL